MTLSDCLNDGEEVISTHTLTWSVTNLFKPHSALIEISTHTLTWSVTITPDMTIKQLRISTHTLTWSVTTHLRATPLKRVHFNSHAHVERDKTRTINNLIAEISTHTLTWSVT